MTEGRFSPARLWRSPAASALLAVGGGLVWSLCFGVETSLWLPWVALIPLILLLGRPRAWLWGWLHGITFWLGSMSWIPDSLEEFGGLTPPVAAAVMLLLASYLGSDMALFGFFGAKVWRRGGLTALWALPGLWVVLEWWRGIAFGRFPWNLAAYAWVDFPGALQISAWIGAFGVCYLVLFSNVGLALALTRRRWVLAVAVILLPMSAMVVAGRFSGGADPALRGGSGEETGAGNLGARHVRIVQPDSPIVSTEEEAWESYRRLIEMSAAECRTLSAKERETGPALLVWPESAVWPWSFDTAEHLRRDVRRLNELGCEVFMGSLTTTGSSHFNSAMLVSGGAPLGVYSKRRLVPWGEYVPLADLFPFIGKLARQAGSFSPGRGNVLLPWGEDRLGTSICYEIIFPLSVAQQVRAGATVLVTITNDAWYGDTAAPRQHFRAARFRAAENRRPVVRAALTGISGLIDSRGAVVSQLGVGERGVLRLRVAGRGERSLYSRAPWWPIAVSGLLAAFAIVACWRQSPR